MIGELWTFYSVDLFCYFLKIYKSNTRKARLFNFSLILSHKFDGMKVLYPLNDVVNTQLVI